MVSLPLYIVSYRRIFSAYARDMIAVAKGTAVPFAEGQNNNYFNSDILNKF
jgi:hypothetical protein